MSSLRLSRRSFLSAAALAPVALSVGCARNGNPNEILNVSYDPTRELYEEVNARFVESRKGKSSAPVSVKQSHGGSGKQARSVMDGLKADVVTLALAFDVDALVKPKLVAPDWRTRFPNNACPFTSTIVFLVRKGNPKGIAGWDDLTKSGVEVITPSPKTSGGARWNYLAAWGHELARSSDPAKAEEFVASVFANVPVLDSGARGATTTFVERKLGDVLVTWENEALLTLAGESKADFEIIVPKTSILAEPPVAIVDRVVEQRGTRGLAEAYLNFLYESETQKIAAKHFFRPTDAEVLAATRKTFPALELFTIDDRFGGWDAAQQAHFADGGSFDRIYKAK
jgi:sulfate/thiosulfate-binding protein